MALSAIRYQAVRGSKEFERYKDLVRELRSFDLRSLKDRALLETLLNYLDEGENKTFFEENKDRIRIRYQPYDWNLNQ